MKITLALITLTVSTLASTAHAQMLSDPSDAIITIQPAADASYNETFASRRQAVAMRDDPKMSNNDKGRAAVYDFAKCLYDSDKGGSKRVLESVPGLRLKAAVTSFANGQCWLRGFLTFRPSAFQGALFSVAYKNEFRNKPPVLSTEALDYTVGINGASDARWASYVALRRFGECVARSDVDTAHRAVIADVASNSEVAAFSSLSSSLSGCITTGQSVTLTRELIKSTLAEVLYRQAVRSPSSKVVR